MNNSSNDNNTNRNQGKTCGKPLASQTESNIRDETMRNLIHSDSFLHELLAYREQLIDQTFADNVMKKISRFQAARYLVIVVCSLLGAISLSTVTSLEWLALPTFSDSQIVTHLSNLSTESTAALIFAAMLALGFTLVASD